MNIANVDVEYSELANNGFELVPSACSDIVPRLRHQVELGINEMAIDLGVNREHYTSVVSAWGKKSLIVSDLLDICEHRLASVAQSFSPVHAIPVDATFFIKSTNSPVETHAHQDISYRWKDSSERYTLTTWLSLDDCDAQSGALSFLPGSHKSPIVVRQDFLANEFIDQGLTRDWQSMSKTVPVKAGDVIVFDSRTWHAAASMRVNRLRCALAVRWVYPELAATFEIPAPINLPDIFGMDTSGKLLGNALKLFLSDEFQGADITIQQIIGAFLDIQNKSPRKMRADISNVLNDLLLALSAHETQDARVQNIWKLVRDRVMPAIEELQG